jgi:hypothetical protein
MPCDVDGWPESPYDIDYMIDRGYETAVDEIKRLREALSDCQKDRNQILGDFIALQRGFSNREEENRYKKLCNALCIYAREELENMNFEWDGEVIDYFLEYMRG